MPDYRADEDISTRIHEAAQSLVELVKRIEASEGERASESALTVEILMESGRVETWEIVIRCTDRGDN